MGQLLRGITERFNPQIHTEEKSLTVNMAKHFAIKNKVFEIFAGKNKFISFLYATGRVNMGAQAKKVMKASGSLYDNAFRIAYKGSLFIPAYAWGKTTFADNAAEVNAFTDMTGEALAVNYGTGVAAAADIIHNIFVALAVTHDPANNVFGDKYNEGDVIAFGEDYSGARMIVMGTPVKSTTSDHYIVRGKINSATGLFSEADLAAGKLLPEVGNRFGEGSEKGYQRERRTKWRINYSYISRVTLTMTGSAMSQKVAIIYNSETNAKMWELEAVMDMREMHAVNMEVGARYSRTSMDATGGADAHKWFEAYGTNLLTLDGFTANMGVVAPVIGDGWVTQLEDSLTISYDPNNDLNIEIIELFITILAQRSPSGSTGNTFIFLGDKLAHIKIDKALKLLIGVSSDAAVTTLNNSNVVYNVRTGEKNKIGFTIDMYYYLENTIIFIEDDLMNHPAFAPQNGGIIGTGNIYVLNASVVNGVSNIDLLARSVRELRAKYIDGMHSLDPKRDSSPVAFSGFDGGRFDLLSEVLPIIYSTESCGIIRASAAFSGGPLTGDITTDTAVKWHY